MWPLAWVQHCHFGKVWAVLAGGIVDPSPGAWETLPDTGGVGGVAERGISNSCSATRLQSVINRWGWGASCQGRRETGLGPLWLKSTNWCAPSPAFTLLPRERKCFQGTTVTSRAVCLAESACVNPVDFNKRAMLTRRGEGCQQRPSPPFRKHLIFGRTTRELGLLKCSRAWGCCSQHCVCACAHVCMPMCMCMHTLTCRHRARASKG